MGGSPVGQARATIVGRGLVVADAAEYEHDGTIAEGLVIGTRPESGEEVRPKTEVVLVVSKGPGPVAVPLIAEGSTIEQATDLLERRGCRPAARTRASITNPYRWARSSERIRPARRWSTTVRR